MPELPVYLPVAEFKSATSIKGETKDEDVERALRAASRAIEKTTGRRYWKDEVDVTRVYTATSPSLVVIDDAAEILSVSTGGSVLSEGSWFAEPTNAPEHEKEPFLWIESNQSFPMARQAVQVTGKFGWPEVPYQVRQMTLIITSKLFKRTREAPFGIVTSGSLDGLALRITRDDPDLELLVNSLKRAETPR